MTHLLVFEDAIGPAPTTPTRWCDSSCPTCGSGDAPGWIDTGSGLAPCPERNPR